ncbi:fungal specific transcription factor domain-containing protein [Colletotrichum scovillei]|uniref:Fungal specific transcription factor domain-containing protein n=1 Tax=Colletotrichum scovillei TaxID=1209932 RepID=A0A9P7QT17_9PEZI|nr:fungal specific transcription factor domain-containing protein [Colletotrichum scovillei]KAG7042410.1 fungal specific transcription factor domain-containing protein [Colletotrichum scovillei]KAG7062442.1 fungal specific transcription factor domain-containing protein [Colletotrichum scovillei]
MDSCHRCRRPIRSIPPLFVVSIWPTQSWLLQPPVAHYPQTIDCRFAGYPASSSLRLGLSGKSEIRRRDKCRIRWTIPDSSPELGAFTNPPTQPSSEFGSAMARCKCKIGETSCLEPSPRHAPPPAPAPFHPTTSELACPGSTALPLSLPSRHSSPGQQPERNLKEGWPACVTLPGPRCLSSRWGPALSLDTLGLARPPSSAFSPLDSHFPLILHSFSSILPRTRLGPHLRNSIIVIYCTFPRIIPIVPGKPWLFTKT